MTWSVSFNALSKQAAQVELPLQLSKAMLHQKPHARDFDMVRSLLSAAIDVCEEGAISVAGCGHVDTNWAEPVPAITAVTLTSVSVRSSKG